MSEDIKVALIQYNQAMDALDAAEQAVQAALLNIKTVAGVATIEVEGQFFQVRGRKEKLYLCELNGKPKGRPLGSGKKNKSNVTTADIVVEAGELGATTADIVVAAEANTEPVPVHEEVITEDAPEATGILLIDENASAVLASSAELP